VTSQVPILTDSNIISRDAWSKNVTRSRIDSFPREVVTPRGSDKATPPLQNKRVPIAPLAEKVNGSVIC
jgi:hypothetical protein